MIRRRNWEAPATPTLSSLNDLTVEVPDDVGDFLLWTYESHYHNLLQPTDGLRAAVNHSTEVKTRAKDLSRDHVERILQCMKIPPSSSVFRLNRLLLDNRAQAVDLLTTYTKQWQWVSTSAKIPVIRNDEPSTMETERTIQQIQRSLPWVHVDVHPILDDVVTIHIVPVEDQYPCKSLADARIPPIIDNDSNERIREGKELEDGRSTQSSHPAHGWPVSHKVVVCDRLCGEAVLRGSDIFVRGILCADPGIKTGDTVAVYADVRSIPTPVSKSNIGRQNPIVIRGMFVEDYAARECVFLGIGTSACRRSEFFSKSSGTAVKMSPFQEHRAGPILPPLSDVQLSGKVFLQNLPSILVGHAINPQPGDVILDMCAAPGGKTLHLASLVKNDALIVACDKSRKKMIEAKALFQSMGASCIVPLALDSTKCVESDPDSRQRTVKEIIEEMSAENKIVQKDSDVESQLLDIRAFPPESFDRIVLDPPCSALGLRPKLQMFRPSSKPALRALVKYSEYQKRLIDAAVQLLKPDGTLTYSTCTISSMENEEMVKYMIDNFSSVLELQPINLKLGSAGLAVGPWNADSSVSTPPILTDFERSCVRRFDPSDRHADTMGFFLAKFRKKPQ